MLWIGTELHNDGANNEANRLRRLLDETMGAAGAFERYDYLQSVGVPQRSGLVLVTFAPIGMVVWEFSWWRS